MVSVCQGRNSFAGTELVEETKIRSIRVVVHGVICVGSDTTCVRLKEETVHKRL